MTDTRTPVATEEMLVKALEDLADAYRELEEREWGQRETQDDQSASGRARAILEAVKRR